MNKVLIIQQYFGLGDIIFCQTIAQDFIKEGYRVVWPVKGEWVQSLQYAYPGIEFVDYTIMPVNFDRKQPHEETIGDIHFRYLPLRYAEWLMKRPYKFHMESKYAWLNKDWNRWTEHAYPRRDKYKEEVLLAWLNIKPDEKFNFIATTYGSDANHKVEINVNNEYRNVELHYSPGFSLFDWCAVIERAETIHAVSSSTLYLFELLDLNARDIHLYCRKPHEKDFSYTEFLYTKPYSLHL